MKYSRYDNIFTTDKPGDFLVRAVDVKSVSQAQFCRACEERNQGITARQMESALKLMHAQLRSFLELETDVHLEFASFRLGVKGTIDPAGAGRIVKAVLHTRSARDLEAVAEALPLVEAPPGQTGPALFSVEDVATGQANAGLTAGNIAILYGHNIKIVNGRITLRNTDTGAETVITGRLAENNPQKVLFLVPAGLPAGTYRVILETCFSGGGRLLSGPRSAELDIDLVMPCPPAPGATEAGTP